MLGLCLRVEVNKSQMTQACQSQTQTPPTPHPPAKNLNIYFAKLGKNSGKVQMSESSAPSSGRSWNSTGRTLLVTTCLFVVFFCSRRGRPKASQLGKRSNSIKRNVNAPVIKRGWLYKQDSTGMKLWKKRWFVLCDMCLFYYRDDKEDNVLGSILLPSFHISMLSVDDHISRKYAFKVHDLLLLYNVTTASATHSNMRTYYFCSDTAKDSESWMQVMTDAALVHTEPLRRSAAERL
uniref:PH domain-containing protein n=1 Tax=Neogobius melanostomus TaxID=47308 RepID=A0A8C6V228_9GOBI